MIENPTLISGEDIHGHHSLGPEPPALANSVIGDWEHHGLIQQYCPETFFGHVMITSETRLHTYLSEIYADWGQIAILMPNNPDWQQAIVQGLLDDTELTLKVNDWAAPDS